MNIADNPYSKPYLAGIIVLLGSYYLEVRISDTLGWSKGMNINLSIPMIPRCFCEHVHKHIICRQTLMFKLFWYTYIHSNRVDIYLDNVTNSLHIMASLTSTSITQNVLTSMSMQIVTSFC